MYSEGFMKSSGVLILKRILLNCSVAPLFVKDVRLSAHNVQEGTLGEKISQYVEIHRKNRIDVRIQEVFSEFQFPGGF